MARGQLAWRMHHESKGDLKMIKLIINSNEVDFTTTIFPDGTSQVWKINKEIYVQDSIKIQWLFENEAELFHVCQLAHLLSTKSYRIKLEVPYLPYARQDKEVSNETSFAINTFAEIITRFPRIERIETYDAHSNAKALMGLLVSLQPHDFHKSIFNHDVVCFPDKGALYRYGTANGFNSVPFIFCNKVRNQLTGEITGLEIDGNIRTQSLEDLKILIVDDICDGGMTFIKVAEALKPFKPKQVDLAVSHGLFSKGKQCLHDAGITNIYATNSLLRNPEGFKVW